MWPLFKAGTNPAFGGDEGEKSPRLLVHLLDYLAVDYGGAVKNGKVLSLSEYKEQQEFVKTVVELGQTLPEVKSSTDVQSLIQNLNNLIQSKADPVQVAAAARLAQSKVIQLAGIPVAPTSWPNLSYGKTLFANTCAKCHGPQGYGDGPSAASLNPKPVNLMDHARMDKMTPFQVFNAVRLGVPNTAMAAFTTFSDQDVWNLAFYAISLRYQTSPPQDQAMLFQKGRSSLKASLEKSLPLLATTSDTSLLENLKMPPAEQQQVLASLRLHTVENGAEESLNFAKYCLQESLADYLTNHFQSSSEKALRAYVEGVEPVEPRLKASDPQAVTDLEQMMGLARAAVNGKKPVGEVNTAFMKAFDALANASKLLQQKTTTPWMTFTLAFGILIREGFEAVLLIVALLGVIRASGAKKARRWVHGGWLAAVGLGVVAWFFSGWLMDLSGLGREMMEGITGLLTVVILLYIGFWLHSRTEITRWKAFIEGQVKAAVEGRNLMQLAFISFLAAFREAIETVLFLRAIWLEGGSETKTALEAGVAGAFVAILLLGWLLLVFSTRIPIKTVFNISSMIMVALAVILTGKAIHSFQEVDLVSITLSPLSLHSEWLGLYPTQETILFQLAVLALSVGLWVYGKKAPDKKQKGLSN